RAEMTVSLTSRGRTGSAGRLGQAGLGELHEGPRPMRQAGAFGRQAVLLVARHLAERTRVSIRHEHRVVAETLVAARRPDQPPPPRSLRGPRGAGHRPARSRPRPAVAPAASRRGFAARPRYAAWQHENPCPARPSAPNRYRARRRAHRPPPRNRPRTTAARSP